MNDPLVTELHTEVAALRQRVAQLENERQQALQSGQQAVQLLLTTSENIFVALVDRQGVYTYVNNAFQHKLGGTQATAGRFALSTVLLEDHYKLQDGVAHCFAAPGVPVRISIRKPLESGGMLWTDWELIGVCGPDGQVDHVLCVGFDISDHLKTRDALAASEAQQRRALEDLEESNTRFEQLVNNIDVTFWMFDVAQQRVIYASPAFEKSWGLPVESLYARQQIFIESIHPDDRAAAISSLMAQREGKQTEREYRLVRPDGTIRHIWDRGFPIQNETGQVVRVAGIATDITEIKLATEKIRQLNETLEQRVTQRTQELQAALVQLQAQRDFSHQITENMREGVIAYAADGAIEYANPFVSEVAGIPLDQIIGRTLESVGDMLDMPERPREQLESRRQGIGGTYDARIRRPDGTEKYLHVSSTPRYQDGQFAGGISVISDLTQRRQAEEHLRSTSEQLIQANQELERAARMKDEFLANVSHELRTPLTGILALTEAMLADTYGAITEDQQRTLTMVEESGRHLLSLINDVLDVAKSGAGKLEISLQPVSAADVGMASLRLVRDLAMKKQQQVSFVVEPAGIWLEADPRRLKQVLVNLLSNAVKFTPEGGQLGLAVHGDARNRTVTFTVSDNGIGIPAERHQTIFEPFTQVQSDFNRAYAGTGLGLTLVSRITALHHGSVSLESEEGKGSRFHVVLPWNLDSDAGAPAAEPAADASPGSGDARGAAASRSDPQPQTENEAASPPPPTILLAEDNAVTRSVITDFLVLHGFRVLQAENGFEAVQQIEAHRPNFVLMDVQMPGMDGITAIQHIRSLPDAALARTPIVVLTAHAMHGAREQFLQAGADGYLSKPLRLVELRKTIGEYLPQRSS